jgi:predicted transglutaminase-like cysteine proteinase
MSQTDTYKVASKVHADVNLYPYQTDAEQYGTPEFWEPISTTGRGDCEDYVLEKRKRLLDAGVNPADLRIGEVKAETGELHSVLVVHDHDANADWIADQRQPQLITGEEARNLGYQGVRLQVPGQWDWESWKL